MSGKVVVYSRQGSEPPVPLTVRIEWLPNGIIKPLLYWTPDGTCYKVVSHFAGVALAMLREGGEGLRFKTLAEIIETPEPDSTRLRCRFETCLYFAHRRFSEQNIVDERYSHAGKEYVPVILDVFTDGGYELLSFWARGARYEVEKTYEIEPRGSFQAGGVGLRHKVGLRLVNANNDENPDARDSVKRVGAVYLELNKWWVRTTV